VLWQAHRLCFANEDCARRAALADPFRGDWAGYGYLEGPAAAGA
jgi:hypothetical protein